MQVKIEIATEFDAYSISEIYKPYVEETSITSEYIAPDEEAMKERIEKYTERTPWIVCKISDKIVGYVYAGAFREREGYKWMVESSVYVHKDYQRLHIAKILYETLFDILKLQGFYSIIAGVSMPNEKSVLFHESVGFKKLALFEDVNYKLGNWHDVLWMRKTLSQPSNNPCPIIPFSKIAKTEKCLEILKNAEERYKA